MYLVPVEQSAGVPAGQCDSCGGACAGAAEQEGGDAERGAERDDEGVHVQAADERGQEEARARADPRCRCRSAPVFKVQRHRVRPVWLHVGEAALLPWLM